MFSVTETPLIVWHLVKKFTELSHFILFWIQILAPIYNHETLYDRIRRCSQQLQLQRSTSTF